MALLIVLITFFAVIMEIVNFLLKTLTIVFVSVIILILLTVFLT